MLKVCKFGGTSLSCADCFKRVKQIIKSDASRKIIVVSAPGKRFGEDIKVTDLLYELYLTPNNKILISKIKKRFSDIIKGLNIDFDLKELDCFDFAFSRSLAEVVSTGEYLTAKIMANYLGYRFCNAKNVIIFKKQGKVDLKKSKKAFLKEDYSQGIVVPGFYGSLDDSIALFPRGGSDLTGAYLSRFCKADIYENFSDVSGIKPISPKIVKTDYYLDTITFKDFKNLSVLNPDVLEKSTYKPVIGTKTKIIIKNTFRPDDKGTTILNKKRFAGSVVFSVAVSGNKLVITGKKLNKSSVRQMIQTALYGAEYKFLKVRSDKLVISLPMPNPNGAAISLYYGLMPLINRS